MKAIGYTRVSKEDQAKSGISLSLQRNKIQLQAQLNDYKLIDIFSDPGKSAKDSNRPGLKKLLNFINKKKINALIVYKIDRLTRNVSDLNILVETLNKKNISLISVQESIDTKSAGGRMFINILGVISQWEREIIGERTADALTQKISNGEKIGGHIPYGYKISGYIDKKNKNGHEYKVPLIQPDPKEQKVISKMRMWRNNGISLRDIATKLYDADIKTKAGNIKWHPYTIDKIIKKKP
ncbi:MAG: recombinase family protein [Pseudomonadota bacterium]|nr:recombinase family protein [Pseudomonadota bacterium]